MVLRLAQKHSNFKNICFWEMVCFWESKRKCSKINVFPAFILKIELPKNLNLGDGFHFWECTFRFWGCFWESINRMKGRFSMRKKNFKGRCEKRTISKCEDVCRTFDPIQYAYADILQASEDIKEIRCNVPLDGLPDGEYTSDFVCTKANGDLLVRECIDRRFLTKPLTVKLLDASRLYWLRRGVSDWGLVINEE